MATRSAYIKYSFIDDLSATQGLEDGCAGSIAIQKVVSSSIRVLREFVEPFGEEDEGSWIMQFVEY